jgi:hypothetical protein
MDCPKCRLVNPDEAQRCDCGYDFVAKEMRESYVDVDRRLRAPPSSEFVRELGRRDVKFGTFCAALGVAVAVTSYAHAVADQSGRSRYFLMSGLVVYGIMRLLRGADRIRSGVQRPFWARRRF